MNKKLLIPIIIVILIFVGIVLSYFIYESPISGTDDKTTLNVSSEGPYELYMIIQDIKTGPYYEGYDNDTLKWMESLGSKKVFFSSDEIVIMNSGDAMKIPSEFATDVSINEIFECNVIENRTLGDVNYPKDVLLVNDVDYITEEIHYFDV